MDKYRFFKTRSLNLACGVRFGNRAAKREGAVAVEFALVGLPFLMLIMAIFEIAILLTINSMLDNAVSVSARLVRTGQADSSMTQDQFAQTVCDNMLIVPSSCTSRMSVDVRPVVSFNPIAPPAIVDGVFDDSATTFNPGAARNLMVVRVWYQHPLVTPFMRQSVSRLRNGAHLMHSTSAFRNEPY